MGAVYTYIRGVFRSSGWMIIIAMITMARYAITSTRENYDDATKGLSFSRYLALIMLPGKETMAPEGFRYPRPRVSSNVHPPACERCARGCEWISRLSYNGILYIRVSDNVPSRRLSKVTEITER